MIHIKGKDNAFFDVDDTLVLWDPFGISWPLGVDEAQEFPHPSGHSSFWLKPMRGNIDLLKQLKSEGHNIIVWSAGGDDWANIVVSHLGLTAHVDLVMSKPKYTIDDIKDVNEFMGTRMFDENV